VRFTVNWRSPIVWIAMAGTAIAGSIMTSTGESPLAASDQVSAVEQVTPVGVGKPGTVQLVDRMMAATAPREAVRAITSLRNTGWWHAQARTLASGATATVVVAAGARIRTTPVNGAVVGLISRGDWFWVQCQRRGSDGYLWGYGHNNGRRGWVRDDLWDVIRNTGPGASTPRPIPWC
jgi:hypothetical protein